MTPQKTAQKLGVLSLLVVSAFFTAFTVGQNTTTLPTNGTYGHYGGTAGSFAMRGFGLLTPVLIGTIVILLIAVIVLAYLLMKEKQKNKRHAK